MLFEGLDHWWHTPYTPYSAKIIRHLYTSLTALISINALDASSSTNISINSISSSFPTPRFFTQKIDHFNDTSGVFRQQYQLETGFFKPGGPILLFQGEESTEMIRIESTILYSWAQELGGIATSIEHRYFGESLPFGNDSWTRDNIQYLTLDNVMSDSVAFVQSIKANVTGAENSPVIVSSGSYGGFLTAMFRLNHPETFFGGVAAAGPVAMISEDEANNKDRFNWYNWVSGVYSDRSAEAAAKIKKAFLVLEQRFKNNDNLAGLQQELGLCSAPTNSTLDFLLLAGFLGNTFSFGAEFNYAEAQPGRSSVARPLDLIVNAVVAQSDPIQVLNVTQWVWYGPYGFDCLDFVDSTSKNGIYSSVPLMQFIPFSYILCTYLPIDGSSISNDTIFLPSDSYKEGSISFCNETWGLQPPTGEVLKAKYHFTPEEINNSERILFSVGQYDPATSIAPAIPPSGNRNASRTLYVSDMAHREDLFAPSNFDSLAVVQARKIELETIKGWIGLY
ncbi:peptidase S28 [Rhodocollybia butyracea]|uniref:Peptidase S28 n=1 Tax=Rhodocollybia butyracea TaxID=206335 RepID=A0A9P5PA68_9AGAR|nr:peptidase S28 [Rhodocollybia butyracea]